MRYKICGLIISTIFFANCELIPRTKPTKSSDKNNIAEGKNTTDETRTLNDLSENNKKEITNSDNEFLSADNIKKPKKVREFFMLLPEKYFSIECCEGNKQEYLKKYLTVEDTKNGYMEGGGDGAQGAFKIVLFKRPDKNYIIGFNSFGEMQDAYYFLEYKNDKWFDISAEIVPRYSRNNIYEFPRYGTTTEVFAKKVIDSDGEFEITDKGEKLYDLKWSGGKFSIKE